MPGLSHEEHTFDMTSKEVTQMSVNCPLPGLYDPSEGFLEALPDGYRFADPNSITYEEVVEHWNLLDDSRLYTVENVERGFASERELGAGVYVTGVRSLDGRLVGSGAIYWQENEAVIGDLFVVPGERNKGIGKAILDRRLRVADAIGVTLCATKLSVTNTLASYYGRHNFVPYRDTEDASKRIYFRIRRPAEA